MTEIKALVDLIQAGGLVGILTILAIPNLRRRLGFDSNLENSIALALKKAFADTDESPILVKSQIKRICDDISDMKDSISSMSEDIAFLRGKADQN